MTQQLRNCFLKILLFFLYFEPIICPPNEHFNRRQDPPTYFDSARYFTDNYGDSLTENRQNLQYQQYQPHYEPHPPQYHRRSYDDSISQETQQFIQQHPLLTDNSQLPYQTSIKPIMENSDLDDKIRSIFQLGTDQDTHLFNNTVNSKFNIVDRMQSDESFIKNTNDTESTTLSSLLIPSVRTPSASSSKTSTMNHTEPTFKIQRTPDGKLSLVFTNSSLQRPTAQQTEQGPVAYNNKAIVYPDQLTSFKGCDFYEGTSLCRKVRNYPNLSHLDTILKREFTQLGLFFAEDLELPRNISQRFGGDVDEIDPCDSEEKVIFPEAGMTKDLRWMLIINNNSTYKQGVRIEECSGKDRPCNVIKQSLPNHYTSVCRQHYILRQLYAITDTGRVVKEHFKIPSCCKCVLRNVSNF